MMVRRDRHALFAVLTAAAATQRGEEVAADVDADADADSRAAHFDAFEHAHRLPRLGVRSSTIRRLTSSGESPPVPPPTGRSPQDCSTNLVISDSASARADSVDTIW
jgi:hypothetical protein